jgi:hypothetical protein
VECAARNQGAAGQGCPFYVSAGWSKKECVIVSTVKEVHSCQGNVHPRGVSQSRRWLLRILPETITIRNDTKTGAIIEVVQLKWKSRVSYRTARRVKHQILGRSQAARARQYQLLPHYSPSARVKPQRQVYHWHQSSDSTLRTDLHMPLHQRFGFPTPPRLGRS